jgi:cytohesin
VRALLAAGADVDAKLSHGHTALMLAAGEGHLEIVKALLAAGANPNAVGATFHYGPFAAWMSAMNRCNKKRLEIMDVMLAAGVEVNPKTGFYLSPLGYAITRDDPVMIRALLKRGADVNLSDLETGETPLMFAARYSSPEVVKALIDVGADVNARNKVGKTTLTIIEEYRENIWQKEIVELLEEAGAKR